MNVCRVPKTTKQYVMYFSLCLLMVAQIFLPHGRLQHAATGVTQAGVLVVAIMAGRRCPVGAVTNVMDEY